MSFIRRKFTVLINSNCRNVGWDFIRIKKKKKKLQKLDNFFFAVSATDSYWIKSVTNRHNL